MTIHRWVAGAAGAMLLACGSSPAGNPDSGNPDSGNPDSGNPDAGAATHTLALSNFDGWCTVTVTQPAGAAFSSNNLTVDAGTVVKLHGEPASSSFEWAPSAGHG